MRFYSFESGGQNASEEGPVPYGIPYLFSLNGNNGLSANINKVVNVNAKIRTRAAGLVKLVVGVKLTVKLIVKLLQYGIVSNYVIVRICTFK